MAGEALLWKIVSSGFFIVLIWVFVVSGFASGISYNKVHPLAWITILFIVFVVILKLKK